jgi:outer membrane receptor for ferrienterochelin and colicin
LQGTHFSGTAGGAGTGIANLIHAVVSGNLSYKVSAGYDRTNQFPNPAVGQTRDELGRLDQRGHFQVNYKLSDVSKVSLSGGIDEFDRREVLTAGPFQEVASGGLGFVQANFARADFNVQLSYNRFDADIRSPSFTQDISAVADIYQGRLQQSLALGHQNTVTGGAAYRGATLDSQGLVGGHVAQQLLTFFLQDEWQLRDNLALTVGLGVDVHSEAGASASARGSLVYSPWKDHTFRLSVARALRNPALLENFEMLVLNQVPPIFRPFAIPPPPTFTIRGNTELDPEEMLSYELGYQTLLFERLRVRLDLFYNRLDRLIIQVQPIFSQVSPSGTLLTGEQFANVGRGSIFGGEVGLDFFIASWLTEFLNYSYQERKGNTFALGFAPHHKGNVGLTLALTKALSATVLVHHVGQPDMPPNGLFSWVNPYTIVNCRLGYHLTWFQHDVELSIQAFNLLDDVHREIPDGDLIERRVSGTIRFRF